MADKLIVYRDKDEDIRSIKKIDKNIYLIIFLMVSIIPITIQTHFVDFYSPYITNYTSIMTDTKGEIFSFYKMLLLILGTSILLILFLYKIFVLNANFVLKDKFNIAIFTIMLIILVTSFFSEHGYINLFGFYDRYEGLLTYLSYSIIFLVLYNSKFTRKQLMRFIFALYPVTIINFITVTLSYFDRSLVNTALFRHIITIIEGNANEIELQISKGIFTTVFNQNMMSGLAAALTILFMLTSFVEKNKIIRILHFLMGLLSFSMLFTTLSSSGFISLVIVLIIMLVLFIPLIIKRRKMLIIFGITVLILATVTLVHVNNNERVYNETIGAFGNIMDLFKSTDNIDIDKEYEILPTIPERDQSALTGRLFIWEETIDLIKRKPIIGYGFDSLAYEIDQNNLEKIAKLGGNYNTLIDKPHNWYLFLTYSGGVLLLLSMLVLISLYIIENVSNYLRNRKFSIEYVYLFGILVFLIQWLVNDSLIGVSVIYWTIIGLAASMFNSHPIINEKDKVYQ